MVWTRVKDRRGQSSKRGESTGERKVKFGLVRWGERGFSYQGGRLAEGRAEKGVYGE